ncbi:MAG: patatin-like phospholipase family protein [Acidobacteriota bacterium]
MAWTWRPWRRKPRNGLVLALGGGGARGIAHLGVLAAIEEAGLPVAAVAGTSAGAVAGAMWLALGGAEAAIARWREFMASGLLPASLPDTRLGDDVSARDSLILQFGRRLRKGTALALALNRHSLVAEEEFDRSIAFLLPDVPAESLRLPFAAVVTDFFTGVPVALRSGPLRELVAASSAIPGVLPPRRVGARFLVDGGVVADVPVEQAHGLLCGPVVAVDAGEMPGPERPEDIGIPRALLRAGVITHHALRQRLLGGADVVLEPAVKDIHWSEFERAEVAIAAGRREVTARIPDLRRILGHRVRGYR